MSETAQLIIDTSAAKLKSVNANFQLKERPYNGRPTSFSPSLFFSGSKSDLRHVIQLCANRPPFSAVVDISIYSFALSCDDFAWLAEQIARYNLEQDFGHFIFESAVSKMQVRFVVRLHLDKRKLYDAEYLGKAVWSAITAADKNYRVVGGKLLEDLRQKERAPKEIDSLEHPIIRMELMKRGIEFALKCEESGPPMFHFNLTIPGLSEPFQLSQCTLAVTKERLTLRAEFCSYGRAALFKHWTTDCLLNEVNSFNLKMMVCHLAIKGMDEEKTTEVKLEMVLHTCLLGVVKERLESTIAYTLSVFSKQLEKIFPNFVRVHSLECSDILSNFEMKVIHRRKLTKQKQKEEKREKERILSKKNSYEYFFYQGLSMEGAEAVMKVPYLFKALMDMLEGKTEVSEEVASALSTMLKTLGDDDLFYRELNTLIYSTDEETSRTPGIRELEIAPWFLSEKCINEEDTKYWYNGFLQNLNDEQLAILVKLIKKQRSTTLEEFLSYDDGVRIDFEAVKCEQCTDSHTGSHRIGKTKVKLTPVFKGGVYRDFYEIKRQYFKSVKFHHGIYQKRPLGITIAEEKTGSCMYLVEEETTYDSLGSFFRSTEPSFRCEEVRRRLFDNISQAVDRLHSQGESQLLLCPSAIAVDIVPRACGAWEVRAKLAAIPAITSENSAEVIAYTSEEALRDPENCNWKEADVHSLRLLKEYLNNDVTPRGQLGLSLICETPLLRGTERLTAAFRSLSSSIVR